MLGQTTKHLVKEMHSAVHCQRDEYDRFKRKQLWIVHSITLCTIIRKFSITKVVKKTVWNGIVKWSVCFVYLIIETKFSLKRNGISMSQELPLQRQNIFFRVIILMKPLLLEDSGMNCA